MVFDRPSRKPGRTAGDLVHPDCANLQQVVGAARDALLTDGPAWFGSLDGLERMLDVCATRRSMDGTWGMGHFGSPDRVALSAALAGGGRLVAADSGRSLRAA